MSQPIGLVQLVSEEAMPLLFPVLALHPVGLVHISSKGFHSSGDGVLAAADRAKLRLMPESIRCIRLGMMPSINETHDAVQDGVAWLRARGCHPVINFTGGTKLMSIGAFQAALKEAATSLYVDGENRCFLDGGTGSELTALLPDGLSLDPLSPRLSVPMILAAHGCEQRSFSRKVARSLVPLARHLLSNREEEERTFYTMAGKDGAFARLRLVRNPNKWRDADKIEFDLPEALAKVAETANMISRVGCKAKLRGSSQGPKAPEHGRRLQWQYQFFEGGWWEVAVADAVERCPAFANVQVNVSIAKGGRRPMEEDILAVQGLQLAYFSCKRTNAEKLQRHLEEVDASARRLGGKYARKYLAVCHLPDDMREDLQKRAVQLHITILEPKDIADEEALLRAAGCGSVDQITRDARTTHSGRETLG